MVPKEELEGYILRLNQIVEADDDPEGQELSNEILAVVESLAELQLVDTNRGMKRKKMNMK